MFIRTFVTTALALLGIYAFWGDALGGGHFLNPFGIMFLLFAALVWFGWQTIREAFKSVKDESNIPILRMGSTIIKGMEAMKRGGHQHPRQTSK
jgi:hypothetical protein